MSKFLWVVLDARAVDIAKAARHMVRESTDQTKTLCGLFVEQEAWDAATDQLGEARPCDNCTEISARHEDAGDQPPGPEPLEFDGIPV